MMAVYSCAMKRTAAIGRPKERLMANCCTGQVDPRGRRLTVLGHGIWPPAPGCPLGGAATCVPVPPRHWPVPRAMNPSILARRETTPRRYSRDALRMPCLTERWRE